MTLSAILKPFSREVLTQVRSHCQRYHYCSTFLAAEACVKAINGLLNYAVEWESASDLVEAIDQELEHRRQLAEITEAGMLLYNANHPSQSSDNANQSPMEPIEEEPQVALALTMNNYRTFVEQDKTQRLMAVSHDGEAHPCRMLADDFRDNRIVFAYMRNGVEFLCTATNDGRSASADIITHIEFRSVSKPLPFTVADYEELVARQKTYCVELDTGEPVNIYRTDLRGTSVSVVGSVLRQGCWEQVILCTKGGRVMNEDGNEINTLAPPIRLVLKHLNP